MSYGFTAETKEQEVSKFIQVTPETAIATGRFIKDLKYEDNNGNPYFEVTVINKENQTANHRWYQPKIDGTIIKTQEELDKKISQFNGVMANLSRRFLGENYVPQGVTSFETLCKRIIADIGNKYINKELRIKVVLNKNNYPVLPNFSPIFEDITTNPSKLSITKYDKVVSDYKPSDVKPDNDSSVMGDFENATSDLPF
jgi:hypothetical protein